MKITKAILLTVSLLAIYYIPQIGLVGLHKYTNLLGNEVSKHFYSVVVLGGLIAYLIVFYLYWKPKPNLKSELTLNIKQLDITLIPYLLLIVFGLVFAEQPLFDFYRIIDYYENSVNNPPVYKFTGYSILFIYIQTQSILIAPIIEELFFRKFMFSKLLEKNKLWTAILISSLCFSAIHFETPSNLVPTFIAGIIYCLIYLKTKNIIYLIIIHLLHNIYSLLLSIYVEPFYDWIYGLNYGFIYWSLFLFGILITTLGIKKITTANTVYN